MNKYRLPAAPPGSILQMTVDGYTYILERVPIENLPAFRRTHNLTPVRPIGGPKTWPPAILYHPHTVIPAKAGIHTIGDPQS